MKTRGITENWRGEFEEGSRKKKERRGIIKTWRPWKSIVRMRRCGKESKGTGRNLKTTSITNERVRGEKEMRRGRVAQVKARRRTIVKTLRRRGEVTKGIACYWRRERKARGAEKKRPSQENHGKIQQRKGKPRKCKLIRIFVVRVRGN